MVAVVDTKLKVSGKRTKISNGPIYDLSVAKALMREHGLRVINDEAQISQSNFDPVLTDDELKALILALGSSHYIESERCGTSVGMTVDCDAYAVRWNRNRRLEWEHGRKIYVKFGFRASHPRCLVVSIHYSKW